MDGALDFSSIFKRLAADGGREHEAVLGGVSVRLVRVAGGAAGRWDQHDDTPETVVVWSGVFDVAFRDHTVSLGAGQCCVVPQGAEHCGTSTGWRRGHPFPRCAGRLSAADHGAATPRLSLNQTPDRIATATITP